MIRMTKGVLKMPGAIMIILVWIFVWCLVKAKNIAPALCGKGISQIGNEYYRFASAGLTHTNLIHLLVNVGAMLWIGHLYENQVGTVKFLVIGIVCAIVSQILFLSIYRNATDSIGGSGYCFSLCGFGLAMHLLVPEFPKMQFGTWSGSWLIIYLIAGNLPALPFVSGTTIVFHALSLGMGMLAALVCKITGLA